MVEKEPVDFSRMYSCHERFNNRYVRGTVRLPFPGDAYQVFLGNAEPVMPVQVGQSEGRVLTGFIWTGLPPIVLASVAVLEAVRAAGLTGWRSYSASFIDRHGAALPYGGLAITGRCGPVDRSRGVWVQASEGRGRARRGLFFDETSWDGSDWFVPRGTAHILVTERTKLCLQASGVENVLFTKLTDDETPEVVIRHSPN